LTKTTRNQQESVKTARENKPLGWFSQ